MCIGCRGADGDEAEVDYPGHVDVTVDCSKLNGLGRYFVLKWTVSKLLIKLLYYLQFLKNTKYVRIVLNRRRFVV